MVITISDRKVQIIGDPEILFEQDSLVSTLAATTDKDADWEYNIDIYMPTTNRYNSIIMTRNSNMLSVDLTRQMLPVDGRYIFQFRGQKNNGEVVYHTDKFELWVKDSIDLNKAYDPMPAEFYQLESEMKQMVEEVKQTAAETLPEINESTNGQFLSNDGTDAQWANVPDSGISQDEADARYLQLSGGTMTGNIDLGDNNLDNVSYVKAAGTYQNAGIQFSSNGTIINFVTGNSTALELSANNVNVVNHGIDNVGELNMTTNGNITRAGLVGGNVNQNDKTCIDFTTTNSVGIWAEGLERVIIDTNGVNVNGNKITNVDSIVAEGSTVENIKFESDGAIVGIICGGTRSATFTASAIDAYDHTISRVGEPLNDTDAARKQDVDAVQTAVNTVSETVDGIIDGTEAIPYLPDNGGTLTGTLNMGNNKITMGATPTETTDVTNKGYVDGVVKVVSDEVDGILAGTTPITLPIASDTHIGGIKVGTGLSITEDGTLNATQQQQQIPVASELTLGAVKVGTGLHIEDDGTLEATAGLYRDPAAGVAFVGPNESKTIMLQKAYQVLYIGYMYISSTVVDPIATTPIYLNAGQNMTDQSSSHLTVSFDENGASFSATNLDSTIGIFMFYGGFQEKTS